MDLVFDILLAGQSNVEFWLKAENAAALVAFEERFLAADPHFESVRFHDGARNGSMLLASMARLAADTRTDLTLDARVRLAENFWRDDIGDRPGPTFDMAQDMIARQRASGVTFDAVIWAQGESDTKYLSEDVEGAYSDALSEVLSSLRDVTGADKVYIQALGDRVFPDSGGGTDRIREIQSELAAASPDIELATTVFDLPLVDSVHLTPEGYVIAAERMADAITGGVRSIGPKNAQLSGRFVEITFDLQDGQQLLPRSSNFGFSADTEEGDVAIVSVEVIAPSAILLELFRSPQTVRISYASAAVSSQMRHEDILVISDGEGTVPVLPFFVMAPQEQAQ